MWLVPSFGFFHAGNVKGIVVSEPPDSVSWQMWVPNMPQGYSIPSFFL
jgi:hypothetical protein